MVIILLLKLFSNGINSDKLRSSFIDGDLAMLLCEYIVYNYSNYIDFGLALNICITFFHRVTPIISYRLASNSQCS